MSAQKEFKKEIKTYRCKNQNLPYKIPNEIVVSHR